MPDAQAPRIAALEQLLARAQGGLNSPAAHTVALALGRHDATHLFWEAVNNASLDAVARLEGPLRERGWRQDLRDRGYGPMEDPGWRVSWTRWRLRQQDEGADARALPEAHARLIAYLRVLRLEAQAADPLVSF